VGKESRDDHLSIRRKGAGYVYVGVRQITKVFSGRLEDLVPAYLSKTPIDPFDDRPLRFRRLKDGVIIYTIARPEHPLCWIRSFPVAIGHAACPGIHVFPYRPDAVSFYEL